jgi:hypothetical protein
MAGRPPRSSTSRPMESARWGDASGTRTRARGADFLDFGPLIHVRFGAPPGASERRDERFLPTGCPKGARSSIAAAMGGRRSGVSRFLPVVLAVGLAWRVRNDAEPRAAGPPAVEEPPGRRALRCSPGSPPRAEHGGMVIFEGPPYRLPTLLPGKYSFSLRSPHCAEPWRKVDLLPGLAPALTWTLTAPGTARSAEPGTAPGRIAPASHGRTQLRELR